MVLFKEQNMNPVVSGRDRSEKTQKAVLFILIIKTQKDPPPCNFFLRKKCFSVVDRQQVSSGKLIEPPFLRAYPPFRHDNRCPRVRVPLLSAGKAAGVKGGRRGRGKSAAVTAAAGAIERRVSCVCLSSLRCYAGAGVSVLAGAGPTLSAAGFGPV